MGHSFIYSITFILILLLFTIHDSLIHLNRILNENIFLILIEIFRFSLILLSLAAKKETQQYLIEYFWLLKFIVVRCVQVYYIPLTVLTQRNRAKVANPTTSAIGCLHILNIFIQFYDVKINWPIEFWCLQEIRIIAHAYENTHRERVVCNGRKQQNYERTKTKELIAINENKHINYPFAAAWINSNILFSPFNYFCSLFNLFCGLISASERWKQMEKEKEQAMKK